MLEDPLLSAEEVAEWLEKEPNEVIEMGKQGTRLFPLPIADSQWKRSHIQQWLEMEDKNARTVQDPKTPQTPNPS
mgnify:FL=1